MDLTRLPQGGIVGGVALKGKGLTSVQFQSASAKTKKVH